MKAALSIGDACEFKDRPGLGAWQKGIVVGDEGRVLVVMCDRRRQTIDVPRSRARIPKTSAPSRRKTPPLPVRPTADPFHEVTIAEAFGVRESNGEPAPSPAPHRCASCGGTGWSRSSSGRCVDCQRPKLVVDGPPVAVNTVTLGAPTRSKIVRPSEEAIAIAARRAGPWRSPEYLAYVRSLPCAQCGAPPPSDPSHHGRRGMGQKSDDARAIALCRADHDHFHQHGVLGDRTRPQTDAFVVWVALETVVQWLKRRDVA